MNEQKQKESLLKFLKKISKENNIKINIECNVEGYELYVSFDTDKRILYFKVLKI